MVTLLYQRNIDQKYKTIFNIDDLFKLKKAFEVEIALNDRKPLSRVLEWRLDDDEEI